MRDEWRLSIDVSKQKRQDAARLIDDLSSRVHSENVSQAKRLLFVYANSEEELKRSAEAAAASLSAAGASFDVAMQRWNQAEGRWQDAREPAPEPARPRTGWTDEPTWEVLVRSRSFKKMNRIAGHLEQSGFAVHRGLTTCAVPARDEEEARELLEEVRTRVGDCLVEARSLSAWRRFVTHSGGPVPGDGA